MKKKTKNTRKKSSKNISIATKRFTDFLDKSQKQSQNQLGDPGTSLPPTGNGATYVGHMVVPRTYEEIMSDLRKGYISSESVKKLQDLNEALDRAFQKPRESTLIDEMNLNMKAHLNKFGNKEPATPKHPKKWNMNGIRNVVTILGTIAFTVTYILTVVKHVVKINEPEQLLFFFGLPATALAAFSIYISSAPEETI